jgi:hypothetical protein
MRLRVGGPQFSRWAESILEILSTTASLLIIGIGAMLVTLPVLLPVFEHLRCQPDLVRRAAGQAAGDRHDYAPVGMNIFVIRGVAGHSWRAAGPVTISSDPVTGMRKRCW